MSFGFCRTKDLFAQNRSDVNDESVVSHLISQTNSKSIYDFHDDSEKEEGMLSIDENQKKPKKKAVSKNTVKVKSGSIKGIICFQ